MNSKIIIGILANTKEKAIEYCKNITKQDNGYDTTHSSVILEMPFCVFVMLQKEKNFCGNRVHYIYAKKEDIETEWYREIILPMFTCGIGVISDEE